MTNKKTAKAGKEGPAKAQNSGMGFLERFRLFMYRRRLKNERRSGAVEHVSVSFNEARRIGILFNASDEEQRSNVRLYADRLKKKHNKKVELLGFYNDKEEHEKEAEFKYYTKKDLNWFYVPGKADVKGFVGEKFDILVNFISEPSVHSEWIMTLSHAKFRVGRYTNSTDSLDLMIDEKKKDPAHFIGLVDMYLKMFNKKPNEAQPV